jgi:hypothetical protein
MKEKQTNLSEVVKSKCHLGYCCVLAEHSILLPDLDNVAVLNASEKPATREDVSKILGISYRSTLTFINSMLGLGVIKITEIAGQKCFTMPFQYFSFYTRFRGLPPII